MHYYAQLIPDQIAILELYLKKSFCLCNSQLPMIEHEDHDLIFVIPFLTDVKLIQKMFYFLKNSMQKYVWFIAINCFAHKLVFSFGHPILQQSMSTQQLSLIPIFRSMKSNTNVLIHLSIWHLNK